MSGQGREEKGLFPKGMILACVILFLLGIGCVGMNLAALFYSFLSAGCSSAADMEQQPLSA